MKYKVQFAISGMLISIGSAGLTGNMWGGFIIIGVVGVLSTMLEYFDDE